MAKHSRTYERFPLIRRIEHLVMLLSFTMLGLTGLPQKYPLNGISQAIVNLFGNVETVRTIHHVSAVIMIIGTIYHFVFMGYKLYVERVKLTMLPTLQDAKDGLQALFYNLGFAKKRPQMGRYTFEEKLEYWAFVWGAVVMITTGFIMWNPIAASRMLPGEFIPAAKAAHGGEAVLAVLAIIVWHFYGVHLKMFNKSMWTGHLNEHEMMHEHPLELADIKSGTDKPRLTEDVLKKRTFMYLPAALIVFGLGLYFTFYFVTLETTAISTLPDTNPGAVYVPQTPTPAPTEPPTEAAAVPADLTWDAYVGPLFQQKCGACHGAMGGLSFGSYADMLKGDQTGPVVIQGDSASSKLVLVQSAGGHPGQLSADELNQIRLWIDNGAVEK